MGCIDPPSKGDRRTSSVSSQFGSKLPLPLYADVRLHIPMTHRNDAGTCWDDIGPLPVSDDGDDLYIMRPTPQPAAPVTSGVLTGVEVCIASSSEELALETDESYSVAVPAAASVRTQS